MRALVTGWIASLVSLAAVSGCVQYTQPVAPAQRLTPAEENFQAVWDGTLEVLRRYHLTVDRQDRRDGLITTHPLVGRQWFEFWRPDAASYTDMAEGSLQTIHRRAKISIAPTSSGAITYRASVEVEVSRSDKEELQITSTSEAYSLFTTSGSDDPRRARLLVTYGEAGAAKVKESQREQLGRDNALEAKLAAEIQIQASRIRALRAQ